MALTYTWDFPAFDCYPDQDGYIDVVFIVHWVYNANDGIGHSATTIGTQTVQYKDGDPFIPFADLTPEIVEGWMVSAMGDEKIAQMQANLSQQIEQQIHPSQVTLPPPWQMPTPPTPGPVPPVEMPTVEAP